MPPTTFRLSVGDDGRVALTEFPALPKFGLYVIASEGSIIRVGESGSGKARLRKGFRDPLRKQVRGQQRKNYIAYAWRDAYRGRTLDVDYFGLADARFTDNYIRRALEAEVTFQLRLANRAWPREMSEVHFLERFRLEPFIVETCTSILAHYAIQYDEET